MCPLLTQGAIEALELCGSEALKATYLSKMVEGVWTGTMNLTEPQAGSDLAAVRTRAVPVSDKPGGAYKLYGQKIFITYGEQDYTDNIIHLVLARTPTAPEGVKGISLFLVPKVLVNDDGSLGERNDVFCVSIEHKLGIHASPTAVLAYGDHGGAIGYLVGEENRGLEYMFIMMNLARFSVGIEGVGIAERAYQRALDYARDRVQGRAPGLDKTVPTATILQHPDVRRMLLTMKAQTEAIRALAYVTGAAIDNARRHPDAEARKRHQAFVELMIPIVKGWSTETAQEVTYLGVQVHGGMGFIEETGAAQHYRDARITTIYEGTTAIQANDLIGRKTARDGGAVARSVIARDRRAGDRAEQRCQSHAGADRQRAPERCRGACQRRRLGGPRLRQGIARGARRVRALSAAMGLGRRRLAARARSASRGAQARGERGRRKLLSRQDRHRAVLRRVPSAAGRRARACHHRRQRVGAGVDRRAVLRAATRPRTGWRVSGAYRRMRMQRRGHIVKIAETQAHAARSCVPTRANPRASRTNPPDPPLHVVRRGKIARPRNLRSCTVSL